MRRAAVSIASNIAEGHLRSTLDYARLLRIARSSLAELETQSEIARRVGFFSQEEYDDLFNEMVIIGRQLNALLKRLKG
jgi:four helix bundle protein